MKTTTLNISDLRNHAYESNRAVKTITVFGLWFDNTFKVSSKPKPHPRSLMLSPLKIVRFEFCFIKPQGLCKSGF